MLMVELETVPETDPDEFGKSLIEQSKSLKHGSPFRTAGPETELPLLEIVIEKFTVPYHEHPPPAVQLPVTVPAHVPFQFTGPSWEIVTVCPAILM